MKKSVIYFLMLNHTRAYRTYLFTFPVFDASRYGFARAHLKIARHALRARPPGRESFHPAYRIRF